MGGQQAEHLGSAMDARPAWGSGGRAPVVAILSAETGSGHHTVAHALAHEVQRRCGGAVRARVINAFAGDRRRSSWGGIVEEAYGTTIVHAPALWGAFYRATNRPWLLEAAASGPARWAVRHMGALLSATQPDLVVAAHPLALWLAAHAQAAGDLPGGRHAPLWALVTDLVSIHAAWRQPGVERYIVGCPESVTSLARWGLHPEDITVAGLPIDRTFGQIGALSSAHDPGRRLETVLVMGGGDGAGGVVEVTRAILRSGLPLGVIAICGRNQRAYSLLRAWGDAGGHLRVYGMVDGVAPLMARADVVITKAGSVTIAEAAAAARPIIISATVPGQESGNGALLARYGAGLVAHGPANVVGALRLLHQHPTRLTALAHGCRLLARPQAAETVAMAVQARLGASEGLGHHDAAYAPAAENSNV